jgi:hypothetical protein
MYPTQPKASTHALGDIYSALRLRRDILGRGGDAELLYKIPNGELVTATDDIVNAVLKSHGETKTWAELEAEAATPVED